MPSFRRQRSVLALSIALALVAALVALRRPAAAAILAGAAWVEGLGWIAPLAYVLLFTVSVPLFVPAAPFLLAGGVLFGALSGSLLGLAGNLAGGALSFALGRYLLRRRIESRLGAHRGFTVAREVLRREGLRGAALIRFSPALPAWLINYTLGVSPITWRQYLLSSAAIVPTVVLYSFSGAGVGDLAKLQDQGVADRGLGYHAFLALGLATTLVASWLLARRAKQTLEGMNDE